MPAIKPARLKQQTSDLVASFNQPAQFVRKLHHLLELYSDHTHRKGQSGEPSTLVRSYKAPVPVMRQVWLELAPLVEKHPQEILPLCDALWSEPNYDLRLLAARLLGQVPVDPPHEVTVRLQAWVDQAHEKRILDGVFSLGLTRMQAEAPNQIMELVASWLESSQLPTQQAGLRALLTLVDQSGSVHLPSIFRLLTPFLRTTPHRLRPDIVSLVSALARCSPYETAFILRQNLTTPDNPDTPWIIRQVLEDFPEEQRRSLRQALKTAR